jgi:hypothetical protein
VSWVTIKDVKREAGDGRDSGDGKVKIRVEENPGPARSTTLLVAGQSLPLTQEAKR